MIVCQFCKHGKHYCGNVKGSLICTRETDHSGDHVACGGYGDHNLGVWPNESNPAPAATAPTIKPNDGGTAFPCSNPFARGRVEFNGMTLRDYFAGQALAGMLANQFYVRAASEIRKQGLAHVGATFADCAYDAADAMLAARDASPK